MEDCRTAIVEGQDAPMPRKAFDELYRVAIAEDGTYDIAAI